MVTKSMRQSSRNAMDIHRQFGRTSRAVKITPVKYETVTTTLGTSRKLSLWARLVNWVKSLGQAKAV
jgi:hypothetical protein